MGADLRLRPSPTGRKDTLTRAPVPQGSRFLNPNIDQLRPNSGKFMIFYSPTKIL